MKLRPAQTSAGLRAPTSVGFVRSGVDAVGGSDPAAAAGRFGGPGRCAAEVTAAGFAAGAIACGASGPTAAATGVA